MDFTTLTIAAFYFHPDLDVARAQWAVVVRRHQHRRRTPEPDAQRHAGLQHQHPPALALARHSDALDIPIETAGKRGYRIAQAAQLSQAARLNIASVGWQVRSRVRRSLVDLYAARETEAFLTEQQAIQTENVRLLEAQLDAGAISAFEVTQARLAADAHALRACATQSGRAPRPRVQLAAAISVPVGALDGVAISFDGLHVSPSRSARCGRAAPSAR